MISIRSLLLTLSLLLPGLTAAALSEADRAQQIASTNKVGSPLWLIANANNTLGLYYDPLAGQRTVAVLLLHDLGENPNWPEVIAPLRRTLGDKRCATLSIQMPALPTGIMSSDERYRTQQIDARARINAALDHLASLKITTVVILGRGYGATQAYQYLGTTPPDRQAAMIKGIITIDLNAPAKLPPDLQGLPVIEKLTLPTLDIFSAKQNPAMTQQRKQAAKRAGNNKYRQIQLVGAWPDFRNNDTFLTSRIDAWLKAQFPNNP